MSKKKQTTPKEGTNPYRVLMQLRKKAMTGIELVKNSNILSYNTAIHQLRGYGYSINTTLVKKPNGTRYGIFELEE